MKMNSIASICKKRKNITLFERRLESGDVQQYISDGFAVYPIVGLPYLTEESILTIFDVAEKEREKWIVRHANLPEGLNFEDTDVNEVTIGESVISIAYGGTVLKPLYTPGGMTFIESRYLVPLKDVMDFLQLYERRTETGTPYIVAKAGFLLQAVILPHDVINETFVEKLSDVAKQTEEAFKKKKQFRQPEEAAQMTMDVDPETGEVLEGEAE